MQYLWTSRRVTVLLVLLTVSAISVRAQKSSSPATAAPATSSRPSSTNTPSTFPNANTRIPGNNAPERPVFVDGAVMFDDGSPINSNIRIERVCGGTPSLQAHADSKGRFSFQLGTNSMVDLDASDASSGAITSGRSSRNSDMPGSAGASDSTRMFGCEIRAVYPGYRSDVFEVPYHNDSSGIRVGTLILHRLTAVQGTTLSLTTALAPKHAQKDYEKGLVLAQKGNFEDAEKHLESATALYPKYAIAWFALGEMQQRDGKTADARQSYQSAIASDSRYVSPYNQLALLAAQEGKWQDAADYSRKVLNLNPVEFVSAYWYNAISNYQLQYMDEAQKSALELLKLDTNHHYPQAESMLGNIFLLKGNAAEAASHLRAYLVLSPKAGDAASVRQMIDRLDASTRASAK